MALREQVGHDARGGLPPAVRDRLTDGRQAAVFLSALAEAPDFGAAATFLLSHFAELAGSQRSCLLCLDATQEVFEVRAHLGLDDDRPRRVSVGDRANPFVISGLGLVPLAADATPRETYPVAFQAWTALPMPQPHAKGTLAPLAPHRVADVLHELSVRVAPGAGRRLAISPGSVLVLDVALDGDAFTAAAELATLAAPVLARLGQLEQARDDVERLAQQHERLTLMVDSLPDPVVITNATNDIIAHNRRAEHLLYVRDDDSPGRRRAIELNNLLFTSFLSKAVMAGGPQSGPRELSLVDPDEGNDLLFEVLAHPLGERVGPEDAFLSVLRDVTDLRRAANELERQVQRVRQAEIKATTERDRLNLILENVADPILVTDAAANIILMNEQAEHLFQVGAAGERSRRELQSVRGNDTKFTSFISDFAISGQIARREQMALVQPASGQELPVEVVSGKIMNQRGEPMVIVSVLHDLTKQVENERLFEALKQLNGELEARIIAATADLAEQNARLQWQAHEVERANKLKSEFLASMSHELRTPINALIGFTALILDGVLGPVLPAQRDALERSRAAAEHLLSLINDILDLAKIEAGKMPLHLEDVRVRSVIGEVAQQIEPMVRKKALEFHVEVDDECQIIHTDRTKVKQVLLNLLSNAVKFTNHGRIAVLATCEPGGVRIDVADTGIGIQEKDLETIWEDFRQVDQSRTREYGGTGLGLSITRKLLDRLGGSVGVRSVFGQGSTFTVHLPLHLDPPPPEAPIDGGFGASAEHPVPRIVRR